MIGGEPEDTTLLRVRLMTAHAGVLYAFDQYDSRLKAFGRGGDLQWAYGRRGEGPGEFVHPTHLAVAPGGSIWVTDGGALRSTIVSAEGAFEGHRSHVDRSVLRLVPQPQHALAVGIDDAEDFFLMIDADGDVRERSPFPTESLRDAHPQVRVPIVSSTPAGDRWAAVFPLGSALLVYDGMELRCSGELVEGGPFPDEPYQFDDIWAIDLALTDSSLLVHARGKTNMERRMVDEYSADDCGYMRTLPLPGVHRSIAYDDGMFYLYHEDPAPTLLALRPVFD